MVEREERFIILVLNERDGEWEAVPDNPSTQRVTPFKMVQNARHQLEVLREQNPDRFYRGGTVIVEEGWAP